MKEEIKIGDLVKIGTDYKTKIDETFLVLELLPTECRVISRSLVGGDFKVPYELILKNSLTLPKPPSAEYKPSLDDL